jgi:cytochrome c oxidase cbb3-type subunit IV
VTYDALRHFADSYGLAAMVAIYLLLCGWVLRPSLRQRNRDAADMIFKDSDHG